MNIKKLLIYLSFFLGILSVQLSYAQTINPQDLSNISVDNLTDAQIQKFLTQAQSSGMSTDQLGQMALARGMKPAEVQKLKDRINTLQNGSKAPTGKAPAVGSSSTDRTVDGSIPSGTTAPVTGTQTTQTVPGNTTGTLGNTGMLPDTTLAANNALTELKPKIFGRDLFTNSGTTFEPNLKLPTPKNYIIGTGDQLLIDIYGYSEASYQLNVSPDGTINVPYGGVMQVAGLSIEAATARIKSKLAKNYGGLSQGNTKISVTLGNIRSIKVIINGEVTKPGTYTLPSLATVINALYSSGGPTDNGSFRNIEIVRGGRKVATFDVYDFLISGDLKNNITLQDQDIINIPPYQKRVEVIGEVKRPAIFEMKGNETFNSLLRFAGGFTEKAYQARVKVLSNTSTERRIKDITADNFSSYIPQSGDKYFVDEILDRFENRVTIEGAVFRPGQYELEPGLTIKSLIKKASGLREDAFVSRGYITRLTSDLNTELVSFDIKKIMSGQAADIPLQREDVISISSKFDLKEEYKVNINGEVRYPGEFPFSENMTLEELIIKGGGFKESASAQRIEISRRIENSDYNSSSAKVAEVFQTEVNKDLSTEAAKFVLKPFDIVTIRSLPGYQVQKQLLIDGEVVYPGNYTVIKKNERISDVIKRAGGLTAMAFAEGASLKRVSGQDSKFEKEIEQQKIAQLQKLQADAAKDSTSMDLAQQSVRNNFVGINLPEIMKNPGTVNDLFLEDGDIIFVPKQLQTVKVNGEVLSPVTVVYEKQKGFKSYIDNAGGFSEKALKKRAYIVYANGTVKSTHKFLFFNTYPQVKQGAEIFVPTKEDKPNLTAQQWVSIGTGLATITAVIIAVMRK